MLTVAIYIKDTYTSEYNRVDLFDDEKISVVSSIQNINDISKTYTDFSQTFTVPATKQNNKIFRHWYDNSNDSPFSTLVKSDAYIEIDTILFRKGKIQLESANLENGLAKDYSITFIGILGNLKDTFAGLFLKDLTSTASDIIYSPTEVKNRITNATSSDVMFPLISSKRNWTYGLGGSDDITLTTSPIRYNELFPALKLRAVLNMIESKFGINFDGTSTEPSNFLNTDARFTNAYLYLKNADVFTEVKQSTKVNFTSYGGGTNQTGFVIDLTTDILTITSVPNTIVYLGSTYTFVYRRATLQLIIATAGVKFTISCFKNGDFLWETEEQTSTSGMSEFGYQLFLETINATSDYYEFYVNTNLPMTFTSFYKADNEYYFAGNNTTRTLTFTTLGASQSTPTYYLPIRTYMPEIKIEDFFSGLLKMFNLTCYSSDGINYTVEQLESYYNAGSDVDITKYVIQDKKGLNRVKTYKKINFDYEKSDSFVNVAFNSKNNIEYGSLRYVNSPPSDGEEYSIKLPFEDLNFKNIGGGLLQVGYCLKTDYQPYIPKPIILYDYNPTAVTTSPQFYFSTALTGTANNFAITGYKAFGQETLISTIPYSLNFPPQQSTLTNLPVDNSLYHQYYENYFANVFNFKARLVKVSAILPTSILTSLKLNDNVLIRDTKYLINTFTTDLTTGEVQFELLTDQRQ